MGIAGATRIPTGYPEQDPEQRPGRGYPEHAESTVVEHNLDLIYSQLMFAHQFFMISVN